MMNFRKSIFSVLAMVALLGLSSMAQVTVIVESFPTYTPHGEFVYLAGSINEWNPGNPAYVLSRNSQGKLAITLAAQPAGTVVEYKFTRGSWETVEKGENGQEIINRTFTFGSVDTVRVTIQNWADHTGGAVSTAAENVEVMDENFAMPQFNRNRRIWLYFPPDYETSGINYPVMYMHDGQNLFDAMTSFAGEWEVDEALNALAAQGHKVPIVVGIDNGGLSRIEEYTPWVNADYGGGEGEKYMQFIVETLKPYIDANYRTLPDRDNTAIMGSSLGGLISHFGALSYQQVFSKAGIFSPSYWFSDSVWAFTQTAGKQYDMRLYQLCGTDEGEGIVPDMLHMNDSLIKAGFRQEEIFNKVIEGGQHNEALWRGAFTEAFLWLFEPGSAAVDENPVKTGVLCYPNPVKDELSFKGMPADFYDSVVICNTTGQVVLQLSGTIGHSLNVSHLQPGIYFIRLRKADALLEGRFVKI